MTAPENFKAMLASSLLVLGFGAHAQAATVKDLSCSAYNALGVATFNLDSKTGVVTSVVNYGQMVFNYEIVSVESKHEPVLGLAASGAGIELRPAALKEKAEGHYKLLFTESLVSGKKVHIGGQFIHYTRDERKDEDRWTALPKDLVTPISWVTCDLELVD